VLVSVPSSAPSAVHSGSLEHDSSARNGQREQQIEARPSGVHVKPFTISMTTDAVPGMGSLRTCNRPTTGVVFDESTPQFCTSV